MEGSQRLTRILDLPVDLQRRVLGEAMEQGYNPLVLATVTKEWDPVSDVIASVSSLHLRGSSIQKASKSNLDAFVSLKSLVLQRYDGEELPSHFGSSLPVCQHLEIGEAFKLTALPSSIQAMTSMTSLVLKDLPALESLPPLGSFPRLEALTITGCNQLAVVPNLISLESLASFKSLSLDTPLPTVPDSVQRLQQLESLSMSSDGIPEEGVEFPVIHRLLPALKRLIVTSTYWMSWRTPIQLSPTLASLENLVSLDLQGCPIEGDVPDFLGRLPKLRHLRVNHQGVAKLTPGFRLLRELIFSSFNWISLDEPLPAESYSSLEHVHLYGRYKTLPAAILQLRSIRSLTVSLVRELPQAITLLQGLQSLKVRGSKDFRLPSFITEIQGLKRLTCGGECIGPVRLSPDWQLELLQLEGSVESFECSTASMRVGDLRIPHGVHHSRDGTRVGPWYTFFEGFTTLHVVLEDVCSCDGSWLSEVVPRSPELSDLRFIVWDTVSCMEFPPSIAALSRLRELRLPSNWPDAECCHCRRSFQERAEAATSALGSSLPFFSLPLLSSRSRAALTEHWTDYFIQVRISALG